MPTDKLQKQKIVSKPEEFSFYDQLYAKHNDLKKKYLDLFNAKFADLDDSVKTFQEKSALCETKSKRLIETLKNEVKRWRGDREFTSRELEEQLDAKEIELNETKRNLENALNEIEKRDQRIEKKAAELEMAIGKIKEVRLFLEEKHNGQINKLKGEMLKNSLLMKEEIRRQKIAAGSLNEEKERNSKVFRGTLAEKESMWTREKILMEQRIKETLEEVAHWNKEALKMENRVRQYEKKLIAAGVGLDYDRNEAKERENAYDALIKEKNKLKTELLKISEQRDIDKEKMMSIKRLEVKKQLDCFSLMTGMKVSVVDNEKRAGKENEELLRFLCRVVDYCNTKMIEFELEVDLKKGSGEFIPKKIIDEKRMIPEEFSHKIVLDTKELPLFLSKILKSVNFNESVAAKRD